MYFQAEKSHKSYLVDATQGHGCDRHFLALKLLAQENERKLHPLYDDPLFQRSSTWYLSTSQMPVDKIFGVGFGPVVSGGYGLCYQPAKSYTAVTITAWRSSSSETPLKTPHQTFPTYTATASSYREHLRRAFYDLDNLLTNPSAKY